MPSRTQKSKSISRDLNLQNIPQSIKYWPSSERPRERLFESGPASLSDAELLALSIRSGTHGQSARELASYLLGELDGLPGLARLSPQELLRFKGLGPAKAASLAASFELGQRILKYQIAERPRIQSASDVLELLRYQLQHERQEQFLGVLLNVKNEVIKTVTFLRGDPSKVLFSVSSIMRQLLREGAASVIFVHNHPSGDPQPSQADHQITERLRQACQSLEITLHDHLIIGSQGFFSFAQQGVLQSN